MPEGLTRTTGKVVAVHGDMAAVRFERSEACGHCHACFRAGETSTEIELVNALHAAVGDTVCISLHERSVLKASLIAYGGPLCGLLLGVWLGSRLGDLYAAAGGILLAGAVFFLLHALEPRFKRMQEFKPRMVSVLSAAPPDKGNIY